MRRMASVSPAQSPSGQPSSTDESRSFASTMIRERSCAPSGLAIEHRRTNLALADPDTFDELARTYRRELQVHCYRMLGSLQDAEDVVQETFLRAWRGRGRYQHEAAPRTWLYRIATNTCLTALARRARRVLPEDLSSASGEVAWLEPYPDRLLEGLADAAPGPEARFDQREATELAFVAAIQYLPARQRSVLLMRDVLGFSVTEVASQL